MATVGTVTPIKSRNTASTSIRPSEITQVRLVGHARKIIETLNNNFNLREIFLKRDLSYAREKGKSLSGARAEAANATGNSDPIPDVVIPVVMPQVEAAVSFLADIFCTGYPIFPVLSKPNQQEAAIQMETLVGEHSVKFAWVAEILLALRDGLKYNLMAMEVDWCQTRTWAIDTDKLSPSAASKNTETYYSGNRLKRLPPYNLIMDMRVQNPSEMHIKGEFAGYTELINRIELKQLFADLTNTTTMNAKAAFESGSGNYVTAPGSAAFYIPEINPMSFNAAHANSGGTNWFAWGGLPGEGDEQKVKYASMYEKSVLYVRIIPEEFGLNVPAAGTVQIWKLIVINRKVLIYCERQTNAHNFLPIIIGQPTEDGLGFQTKSFAENAVPMQDAATALYNSAIESQRRKVYDRIFYDPSRINKADIDRAKGVARIAIKQSAYGTALSEAVYSTPYHDEGVGLILQMAQQMAGLADKVNGQNAVSQGQFQKGNKSRKEFETVMGNSNGRSQVMALFMEYRFFQPIKEIIKLNILQYQPPTTLYNRNTKDSVKIDPIAIRAAALEFKLSDGILPVDKMVNSEALMELLQMTANNPAAAAEWDITGAFMYTLYLQGASWINDFRRTAPQQQAALQNQQAATGVTDGVGNPVQPTATGPQPAAT